MHRIAPHYRKARTVLSSNPSAVAGQTAPAQSFTLAARGGDYWRVDEPEALLAHLRTRADLHEWITAAADKKSYKEITRSYHKPPGLRRRVEPAGIVLDRDTAGAVWLRLVCSDLPRVRRIVEQLASGQAVEGVQSCLF